MLLNLILDKQQNNATERVINQMTNTDSQGGIWYCDSCRKSTTKPNLDKHCECGQSLRYIKFDEKKTNSININRYDTTRPIKRRKQSHAIQP